MTLKEKFDKIENITGVANWRMIDDTDTSYIYFSRIDDKINVYHFHIKQGDSVNTKLNSINSYNDSVYWNWNNKRWYLLSANDSVMEWADPQLNENSPYRITKADSSHISYQLPDGHFIILTKTLPLSSFLVRTKYDYEHGTDLANKDTLFHPHKK